MYYVSSALFCGGQGSQIYSLHILCLCRAALQVLIHLSDPFQQVEGAQHVRPEGCSHGLRDCCLFLYEEDFSSDKTGGVRHTLEEELAQEPDGGQAAQVHQHGVGRPDLDKDALGP